jgi:hypothetical protein
MRNSISNQFRLRLFCFGLLGLLSLAGCESSQLDHFRKPAEKEYFHPKNFSGDTRLPVNLHRVVLLPIYAGAIVPPEAATTLEEVFATALQKELRFEVVRFSREDCLKRFGSSNFSSVGQLPHDFLAALGRDFGAEAVLFVDITSYRAYRPLVLGVRAKLATIEQTRLLWTFDEIFSADDPGVDNSVRHFYGTTDPTGVPVNSANSALQSPTKFAAYVASATFDTLPPR